MVFLLYSDIQTDIYLVRIAKCGLLPDVDVVQHIKLGFIVQSKCLCTVNHERLSDGAFIHTQTGSNVTL